jgi:hypothetical protein
MLATIQLKILPFTVLSKDINIRIHQTIIFPLVPYGFETWSPTLRKKHRLRVFEKVLLWRKFVMKRDEVTGGWKDCIVRFLTCFHQK